MIREVFCATRTNKLIYLDKRTPCVGVFGSGLTVGKGFESSDQSLKSFCCGGLFGVLFGFLLSSEQVKKHRAVVFDESLEVFLAFAPTLSTNARPFIIAQHQGSFVVDSFNMRLTVLTVQSSARTSDVRCMTFDR